MFCIVLVSRTFAVFFVHYLFRLCNLKGKPDVELNELIFIVYGGMIRGAIAFGLVLKIPDDFKERGAIITTTLALVIITTVVFGSFMPIVQKLLVPAPVIDIDALDLSKDDDGTPKLGS